jgi:hypothetical protein
LICQWMLSLARRTVTTLRPLGRPVGGLSPFSKRDRSRNTCRLIATLSSVVSSPSENPVPWLEYTYCRNMRRACQYIGTRIFGNSRVTRGTSQNTVVGAGTRSGRSRPHRAIFPHPVQRRPALGKQSPRRFSAGLWKSHKMPFRGESAPYVCGRPKWAKNYAVYGLPWGLNSAIMTNQVMDSGTQEGSRPRASRQMAFHAKIQGSREK